jgi:hypothetical protein
VYGSAPVETIPVSMLMGILGRSFHQKFACKWFGNCALGAIETVYQDVFHKENESPESSAGRILRRKDESEVAFPLTLIGRKGYLLYPVSTPAKSRAAG